MPLFWFICEGYKCGKSIKSNMLVCHLLLPLVSIWRVGSNVDGLERNGRHGGPFEIFVERPIEFHHVFPPLVVLTKYPRNLVADF